MGVFKKFAGGISIEQLQLRNGIGSATSYPTCVWKDLNGNAYSNVNGTAGKDICSPYNNITPIATNDRLENYNVADYQIVPVGTTTHTSNVAISGYTGSKTFSISVANNTENSITVSCIKFQKYNQYAGNGYNNALCLVCAYYLDESEWVTIEPGQVGALTVVMTIGI